MMSTEKPMELNILYLKLMLTILQVLHISAYSNFFQRPKTGSNYDIK